MALRNVLAKAFVPRWLRKNSTTFINHVSLSDVVLFVVCGGASVRVGVPGRLESTTHNKYKTKHTNNTNHGPKVPLVM
jgi:hypothetical protein